MSVVEDEEGGEEDFGGGGDIEVVDGGSGDEEGGEEEEEPDEYVHVDEKYFYLEYIIRVLGITHAIVSFCMCIAYYNLKIPLALFKREKEVARRMEFDGLYLAEQPEDDDMKGHWDKLVISAKYELMKLNWEFYRIFVMILFNRLGLSQRFIGISLWRKEWDKSIQSNSNSMPLVTSLAWKKVHWRPQILVPVVASFHCT